MRFQTSILSSLLKPLDRRSFGATVARHDADAYDKGFKSWDHLVALLFAQLSGASSLRGLEATWNAHTHHHYHLGAGKLRRSTLSDANQRRPLQVFAETFAQLSGLLGASLAREGREMVRLIDSTPIPLDEACTWAQWNGRTRGLKMHVVYDPHADHPRLVEVTPSTINDIEFGKRTSIERGATYVFDKAYCAYDWWVEIHQKRAFFVTRPKKNARFRVRRQRLLKRTRGDGFVVLDDAVVTLASRGDSKLDIPLRRVVVRRDVDGKSLVLITNDLVRSAVGIGRLYKTRWQIELLFRWLKQHLKLRQFLGRSENAVRLQALAAMIAFVLLRVAQRTHRAAMPALRFAELASSCLFTRKPLVRIDKPPDVNPSGPASKAARNQLELSYA